jgi:hypothetical protein
MLWKSVRLPPHQYKNHRPAPREEPVPNEGVEGGALHEPEEKGDAQVAEDGRGDDADDHGGQIRLGNAVFGQMPQLEDRGPGDDGEGEKEGEAGRRFTVEADEQRRGDGDARAGNAGNQGEALGDADDQGEFQGDPVHLPVLRAGGVGQGEDNGEADQEARDEQGAGAEDPLNRLFQGLAGDGGRDGSGDDVKGEPVCRGVEPPAGHPFAEADAELDDVPPEIEGEGNEGPEMEGDIEGESRLGPVEKPGYENEMGGAADGEDLGEALDCAEKSRVKRIHF